MDRTSIINLAYLLASVLFILGLKGLTHPRTAVRGNLIGALGMFVAVAAVLLSRGIVDWGEILAGVAVGSLIGAVLAVKIQMTAMPQLVALFNGFGGGASVLVAAAELHAALVEQHLSPEAMKTVPVAATALIGAVTFWGSLIAFAKLQELIKRSVRGLTPVNALLGLGALAVTAWLIAEPTMTGFWVLVGIGSILGFTLVLPIGGADMPVVIALLNSYSGLAAAATGFVLGNNVLIIAGSLVGASGIILTSIMCKAMNRSLLSVLFGTLEAGDGGPSADEVYGGRIKKTSAEEVAMLLDGASRVVFVPGYGLAVAQAQHALRDLANALKERGVEVQYAIHPVAGRMPGHMNVLLAEADVPYEELVEMEQINPTMDTCDVAIVVGANDVVNPAAKTDPNSPIAGMPIIDVDKARTCVVIKRSLSPGFAGIPNPLFAADNTLMLFGDAKQALVELAQAVKEN
ncbi:MAG: NAD(P)(+) transhydrogenase (Re/Si-specific) subunit beta [Deltaproteobacteria bacterium]|nr:MAG: NAD(P)(+) transhydrogenase (Re/Si-specific) subunit beta [Deltaproteobacteria bacterium]